LSTVIRIMALLDCARAVPTKDAAEIITAAGIDAGVRIKALEECLRIAESEERKCTFSSKDANSPVSVAAA
jgi:hypothetical protein